MGKVACDIWEKWVGVAEKETHLGTLRDALNHVEARLRQVLDLHLDIILLHKLITVQEWP